jgi:hypothetical protein
LPPRGTKRHKEDYSSFWCVLMFLGGRPQSVKVIDGTSECQVIKKETA